MTEKFFSAIREYKMLTRGDSVCVGVSGGADSMCLLDLLRTYSVELGITLKAAHVNHCLRGAEADRDEAFVKSYCEINNIPFFLLKADIHAISAQNGESTELCARKVRYDFFESLKTDKIATAHTRSDSVETMLMNLSRGASLNGLCSIPPVRDSIIRPLIYFSREETERYCREHGIQYVTDSTNLTDEYTRNKFRHRVVPAFREINPAFEENAARCVSSLREDSAYISEQAEELYTKVKNEHGLDAVLLSGNHKALRTRVISRFIAEISGADYEKKHIELIDDNLLSDSFSVVLPGNEKFSIKKGKLFKEVQKTKRESCETGSFYKNSHYVFTAGGFSYNVFPSEPRKLSENEVAVDFSKIDDIINIRPRKEGDMIRLPARHCTKTLKKLYNELKIPPEERNSIPILCDGGGVIWCAACGLDEGRKITKNTSEYLIIKKECAKNDG